MKMILCEFPGLEGGNYVRECAHRYGILRDLSDTDIDTEYFF